MTDYVEGLENPCDESIEQQPNCKHQGSSGTTIDSKRNGDRSELAKIKTALTEDTIREIVENAQSISLEDDRVVDCTWSFLELTDPTLESLLFTGEVIRSVQVPEVKNNFETGTLKLWLQNPIGVAGYGDGYVDMRIHAEPSTHGIKLLTVTSHFAGETEKRLLSEGRVNDEGHLIG